MGEGGKIGLPMGTQVNNLIKIETGQRIYKKVGVVFPFLFPFLLEYSRVFTLFRLTIWSFKSIWALSLPSL
jgi:hypothetical protein